jgi:hypothetical protein
MEERRNAHRILVKLNIPTARPRHNKYLRDLREIRLIGLDLTGSGQELVEGCFEHSNKPSCFIKGCEIF